MNNGDLELKTEDLRRAYAGSISIDREGVVKHRVKTNPIIRPFYEYLGRYYSIGCRTTLIGREHMVNQGELHWDIEEGYAGSFIIYAIKTKKGSGLQILGTLLSEAEKVAKIKGFSEISGYSRVFRPKLAERHGWRCRAYDCGFNFVKTI
jgi:hypothetical protein